ncbi:MAG: OmpH family outer membrane protein [Bacteroidales bacterium]|nr:OmpH family outer membrane protein [Bacteroidales bacterium]
MENKTTKILLALNAVLLLGLIGIYIIHFAGIGVKTHHNADAVAPINSEGGLKLAYIDSDTLLAKYQYAKDLEKQLLEYKDSQERNYTQQMEKFQKDYQDYLQNGANLTLTQQQSTEAELKQRAERLSTLEQELMSKIAERQLAENTKLLNAIFAFVREYNAENYQYDVIFRKTFNDSPTMYLNPGMDITNEIVEGLNKEYESLKKKQ